MTPQAQVFTSQQVRGTLRRQFGVWRLMWASCCFPTNNVLHGDLNRQWPPIKAYRILLSSIIWGFTVFGAVKFPHHGVLLLDVCHKWTVDKILSWNVLHVAEKSSLRWIPVPHLRRAVFTGSCHDQLPSSRSQKEESMPDSMSGYPYTQKIDICNYMYICTWICLSMHFFAYIYTCIYIHNVYFYCLFLYLFFVCIFKFVIPISIYIPIYYIDIYFYLFVCTHTYLHTLHYMTLHYIAWHYITLQHITLLTYMHACMQRYIHRYIYVWERESACVYRYLSMYIHTCLFVFSTRACMYKYIYIER